MKSEKKHFNEKKIKSQNQYILEREFSRYNWKDAKSGLQTEDLSVTRS